MMALGSSSGIGIPSSSSSNLSASASPFTIDQFSSKPGSTYDSPFTPTPSAPQPVVEADPTRDMSMPVSSDYSYVVAGSVNPSTTRCPAINSCDTSSDSGLYVSEGRPYHSPFISPVVSEERSSLMFSQPMYDPSSINVSSQVDYMPHWQGVWKGGLSHGKEIGPRGSSAIEKLKGSSSFFCNEGPTIHSGGASGGESGILYGLSTDDIQIASHVGSFNTGILDKKSLFSKNHEATIYVDPIDGTKKDRCSESFNIMNMDGRSNHSSSMMNADGDSLYSQNLWRSSPGTQFLGPTSSFPEFSRPGTFQESPKCFINNQTTYGSHDSCIQPHGLFVKDPTLPMQPACAEVIKCPANDTSSSARDTDKIVGNRIDSNGGFKLWDIPHLTEEKGYFMSTRPERTEDSCYTNNMDKEGNYWNFAASTSKGEVPTNSQLEVSIDFAVSKRPASQITDTSVSYGFSPSFDYVQSYNHTKDPLENHILALDSPCWKGAQASYSSHNNIIESLPGIQFLKQLDGCLDVSVNRVGPPRVASQDLSISNANFRTGCAVNAVIPSQASMSESSCAAKELSPIDSAKELLNYLYSRNSIDDRFHNGSDNRSKEPNLLNNMLGNETKYSCTNQCNMENRFLPINVDVHAGIQDEVTSCDEAADAGAVAYHAAENVLYSPPAQEVCEEHHKPPVKVTAQSVDISALVNAMHGLSEVLYSNCSADSCGLTEENQESMKRVIRNLDACLSKKIVDSTPVSEFMVPQQSTSIRTGEGGDFRKRLNACLSKKIVDSTPVSEFMVPQQSTSIRTGEGGDFRKVQGADQPHQKYQATVAPGKIRYQNIHDENINCSVYCSQARCLPYFLPLEHNKRITSDDKMVQGMKKVLDENFDFEEEMQPQVLLFKNLWLEAEARLCSISYRAHFDHMRILMDGYKLNKGKEGRFGSLNTPDAVKHVEDFGGELLSRSTMLKQKGNNPNEVQQQTNVLETNNSGCQSGPFIGTSNPEIQGDHAEGAVLARLNTLKQGDEKHNEVQQQPIVHDTNDSGHQSGTSIGTSEQVSQVNHAEAAALGIVNIEKQRDIKSGAEDLQNVDIWEADRQWGMHGLGYTWKNFGWGAMNDQIIRPRLNNNQDDSAGSHDSSSSEWEDIYNDEFSWHNE